MDATSILRALCPPVCAACRSTCAADALLCAGCVHELNSEIPIWGDPPSGVDDVVSSFPHEGAARDLLQAFKFDRMTGLSAVMAGYMVEHVDWALTPATVVAVPPSRLRQRIRGFDPAGLLAAQICSLAGVLPPVSGLILRTGQGRQRGRGREQRLAAPPLVQPAAAIAGPVLLVDDVITTGATISSSAAALKRCGAERVTAISFTRRL
jgi:predicted amidophosphoribosyltransferase